MTLDEFRQSLTATEPPARLTHALAGLWWDAKGDWKRAHDSAQQDAGIEGCGFTRICIANKAIKLDAFGLEVIAASLQWVSKSLYLVCRTIDA